jgi:hypothetical protein
MTKSPKTKTSHLSFALGGVVIGAGCFGWLYSDGFLFGDWGQSYGYHPSTDSNLALVGAIALFVAFLNFVIWVFGLPWGRLGEVSKDDWFKIALISSIFGAALIIAIFLHWKSDS